MWHSLITCRLINKCRVISTFNVPGDINWTLKNGWRVPWNVIVPLDIIWGLNNWWAVLSTVQLWEEPIRLELCYQVSLYLVTPILEIYQGNKYRVFATIRSTEDGQQYLVTCRVLSNRDKSGTGRILIIVTSHWDLGTWGPISTQLHPYLYSLHSTAAISTR